MRHFEQLPAHDPFRLTVDRRARLTTWLQTEIQDAFSARTSYDMAMLENMRQYEGVPKQSFRTVPYEGAPNIEFNFGAVAVDTIYAQSIDLVFAMDPVLKVLAANPEQQPSEHPLQRFVDWGVANEWNFRRATEQMILDDIRDGTGVLFIPWSERVKTTDISRITNRGPDIRCVPLEDFVWPGGTESLDSADWVGIRMWLTPSEMRMRGKIRGWDVELAKETAKTNQVRSTREHFGKTRASTARRGATFEIIAVYANVDVDEDGIERDLLIFYDRTSNQILKAISMPYDRWPIEAARYQLRPHMFGGIGVLEMGRQFQQGASEFLNNWLANSFLANMRGFKGPPGATGTGERILMRPGKYYPFASPEKVEIFQLAEVYPSAPAAVQMLINIMERRTGVNESSAPSAKSLVGNRTPGITALSVMQQASRRFTPAFDSMRLSAGGAVKQCLFRYQERLLAADKQVEDHITQILGAEDGGVVIELLKDPQFDNAMKVELAATSATVNRLQERQDAITLAGLIGQYYDKVVQLMGVATTEGIAEPMRETARKVAEATGEIIKRTVQTFDTIRDPERFVIDLEKEIDAIPGLPQNGVEGLLGLLGGAGGASGDLPGGGLGGVGGGLNGGGSDG